jgi:hypothetical protein
MIQRVQILLLLCCLCCVPLASAADLPFIKTTDIAHPSKPIKKLKKQAVKLPQLAVARKPTLKSQSEMPQSVMLPKASEIDLQWVLDPLVAHADGNRREGSASAAANLIVVEPSETPSPHMTIELSGHVVKTVQTTARIDVRIGNIRRSIIWKTDDVEAGRFKVEFKAAMTEEKLPNYFPVSAIALVTKSGESGAVMVSLQKIVVRLGSVVVAESQ